MTEYRVGDLVRVANPAEARGHALTVGGDPMQAWFDQVGIVIGVLLDEDWEDLILATVCFPSGHVQRVVSFFERVDHD